MEFHSGNTYCNYEILAEEKLIVELYKGEAPLAEVKEYLDFLIRDPKYNKQYDLLTDIRQAVYTGTIHEVESFAKYLIENDQAIGIRKTAVLYSTPNQHAYAIVFVRLYENIPHLIKIFTDEAEAIAWLRPEMENTKITKALNKIKTEAKLNK